MGSDHFFSLMSQDIDEISKAVPAWNLKWHQLSRGAFQGVFKCVHFDRIDIFYLNLNQAVQIQGSSPCGTVSFGIEISSQGRSIWQGLEYSNQDVLINSEREIDWKVPAGYEMFVITAKRDLLLESAGRQQRHLYPEDFQKILGKANLAALSAIKAYLQSSFDLLASDLDKKEVPDAELITKDIVPLLVTILLSAEDFSTQLPHSLQRAQLMKKLGQYMVTHLDQPLTLGQLCMLVGISERSLNNYFHELLDMSPMAYFKALRLNRVRAALKVADPARDKVTAIAKQWGFQHMGYFSVDYKDMFGESPSETLGRSVG